MIQLPRNCSITHMGKGIGCNVYLQLVCVLMYVLSALQHGRKSSSSWQEMEKAVWSLLLYVARGPCSTQRRPPVPQRRVSSYRPYSLATIVV